MVSLRNEPETAALTAYDLWKEYNQRAVVQGVSFNLDRGEVLGLLGANGAGKTTTVGMLYGAVIPTRGFVKLGNYDVKNQGRKARMRMGIVTQEDNLDPDFTVIENLIYFAQFYRITGKKARARAGELLARVGLENYAQHRIDELSGGLKRRLVLARALINHPQVVFLDEPTTGLDPDARQDFWRLVIELKEKGAGILLTTHYMDEAQRLCDRLILIQQGKVIDEGTPKELIARTAGLEVVEIAGIKEEILQQLTNKFSTWYRPFGSSYLIGLPIDNPEKMWENLSNTKPILLSRRQANLEDVFLRLTGKILD
ncbi:ABC transporter ATP-binding protein [Oscillatoria salina]|uniref:ABC transporter ATP-binding protein n=1 Tax=Oscillatoria salina TaxID=331517 RepID=UPI001CCAA165|nr:ABC transporter ATP-binding protein [Oscillatoria salina]MBZ8178569.1 ABC transporter ATP-binding protein [Oscillatoria salina IIICB1]